MRTSKVKHRHGPHPRPFQWHNETNSLPFTILSHITYFLHFFTCLSLRSIPALTKLTASPGQGHRKGMWKYVECENVGKSWDEDFPGFLLFFKTVVHFSLFLYSKDSPRILQSQSFACCAVRSPASRPQGMRLDKHIKPTQGVSGWTAQKNPKESTRCKKFVVSPTWFLVSILRWSSMHPVSFAHIKKDNLSTGPHLESQCAHVDHMRRLGLCDVQHLAPPYTWIYLAQARPEPVPNLRGRILSNVL